MKPMQDHELTEKLKLLEDPIWLRVNKVDYFGSDTHVFRDSCRFSAWVQLKAVTYLKNFDSKISLTDCKLQAIEFIEKGVANAK